MNIPNTAGKTSFEPIKEELVNKKSNGIVKLAIVTRQHMKGHESGCRSGPLHSIAGVIESRWQRVWC